MFDQDKVKIIFSKTGNLVRSFLPVAVMIFIYTLTPQIAHNTISGLFLIIIIVWILYSLIWYLIKFFQHRRNSAKSHLKGKSLFSVLLQGLVSNFLPGWFMELNKVAFFMWFFISYFSFQDGTIVTCVNSTLFARIMTAYYWTIPLGFFLLVALNHYLVGLKLVRRLFKNTIHDFDKDIKDLSLRQAADTFLYSTAIFYILLLIMMFFRGDSPTCGPIR